jgi:hypothetical protein
MASRIRVLALVVAAACGCFGVPQTRVEGETPDERRSSTKVNLSLDADEGRLERGRDAAARGEYATALGLFDAVSRNASAKPELRAQALYQAALVQSNALNPRRDTAQAAATARKLVADFPDSEWRDEAQQLIDTLAPAPAR